MEFLTKGSTFKAQPGSRNGFDLTLFIKEILETESIIDSGDGLCCFSGRNTFIKKGLLGKGTINLKKEIYKIINDLNISVSTDCCEDKYLISKTILDKKKHYGSISLKEEIKRILDYYNVNYSDSCCTTYSEILLKTFLDTNTPSFPVGVFNVNDQFIGFANDNIGYAALWNSDVANQALGFLLPGDGGPTSFKADVNSSITEVRGLRYYYYNAPNNAQLFVGDNDIVRYGSTQKKGSIDGVSISTDTRREWNRNLHVNIYKSKITPDTVRTLNCTGYVTGNPLYVFHNEDSEYAAVSWSNGFLQITGQLPLGLKACSWSGRMLTDYNNVTNWNELTQLYSWYNFSTGGTVWGFDPTTFPSNMDTSIITQLCVGENTTGIGNGALLVDYPYVTATNFPILQDLVVVYNTGDVLTGSENWFLTMPKVTNYFTYRTQTATQVSAAVADAVWNNVATALNGVVPVGLAKELRIQRTNNVSAASLASRNYLIGQGWTIVTN